MDSSERGKKAAAQNKNHHKLGLGGYKSAEPSWDKDELIYSGSSSTGINYSEHPRAWRFFRGRANIKKQDGKLYVQGPEAEELHRRRSFPSKFINFFNIYLCINYFLFSEHQNLQSFDTDRVRGSKKTLGWVCDFLVLTFFIKF
jgi:hypothetical protein